MHYIGLGAALSLLVAIGTYAYIERTTPKPYVLHYGDMPPLSPDRMEMYAAFRMQFFEDGYPGRVNHDGELVPHPIYGAYLIADYLSLYEYTKEQRYLDAARKIGDAAISRMTKVGDALIFYYLNSYGYFAVKKEKYYSGLTQARYMQSFWNLYASTKDERYKEASEAAFRSLMIPVSEGGVMHAFPDGSALIEELPDHDMVHYTFNGWLSAIINLHEYAKVSHVHDAEVLLEKNLSAVKRMLPLFDMPEYANTRYRLAGRQYFRIELSDDDAVIKSIAVDVPGEGVFKTDSWDDSNRFANHYMKQDDTETLVSLVMNYISYPKANELVLDVEVEKPVTMTVSLQEGEFTPFSIEPEWTKKWREIKKIELKPGDEQVRVEVPWEAMPLVIYPTNFARLLGGKYYNSYHFIHLNSMRDLYERTKDPVFAEYEKKWRDYVAKWPSMPMYRDEAVELEEYVVPSARTSAQ